MITQEHEYYIRFILLLLEAGTDLLREILEKALKQKGETLNQFLNSAEPSLRNDRCLAKIQKDTLYPQSPHISSIKDFDITILSHLLIKYLKVYINNNEKQGVKDIRDLRNNYHAHAAEGKMNEATFRGEWNQLATIIRYTGNGLSPEVQKKHRAMVTSIEKEKLDITAVAEQFKILDQSRVFFENIQTCLDGMNRVQEQLVEAVEHVQIIAKKTEVEVNNVKTIVKNTGVTIDDLKKVAQNTDVAVAGVHNDVQKMKAMLYKIKERSENQGRITKVVHTVYGIVYLSADEQETVDHAEAALIEASNNSIAKKEPTDLSHQALQDKVTQVLEDIENLDVQVVDVRKGSVVFEFKCFSLKAILELIDYFYGSRFQRRLGEIANVLEEIIGKKVCIAAAKIDKQSIQDVITKMESKEYEKVVQFELSCTGVDGLLHALEAFEEGYVANSVNELSKALSESIGKPVTLHTSIDMDQMRYAIKSIQDQLDDSNLYVQDQAEVTKPDPLKPVYTPVHDAMQSEREALKEHIQSLLQSRYKQNIYNIETEPCSAAMAEQSAIIGETSLSKEALAEQSAIIGETDQRLPKEALAKQSSIIGETDQRLPKEALAKQSSIFGETDQRLPKEALAKQSSIIGETDQRLPKEALAEQSSIIGETDQRLPKEALAEQSSIIGETDQRLSKAAFAEQSSIIGVTTDRRLSKGALAEQSSIVGETKGRLTKEVLPEQLLISGKTDFSMPKILLSEYSKTENSGNRQSELASALVMNCDQHYESLTEQAQRSYSRPYDYISLIYQKEVPLHVDFNSLSTISSCAILSNGRIMIADSKGLSVVNIHTGLVEQQATLNTFYSDITVLPNDQVAVSMLWKLKIVILSAHDMSFIRSIPTKNCPTGITYHQDEVYVVCFPYDKLPYVDILNLQSGLHRKIKCDELTFYPYTRIAVSMDAKNFYITASKLLIRYSAHGQVIARYRCIDTHPNALTILDDGSLLVVSERIDYIYTIHHISADLQQGYELQLEKRDGRFICVDSVHNGIYLISEGTINVYYMQRQDSQWQFDKKQTPDTTNEKLSTLKAEKKAPSVKTVEKLDIFKTETEEKLALLKAGTGFPSLEYDEELTFLEDDEELTFLEDDEELTSLEYDEELTFLEDAEELTSLEDDEELTSLEDDEELPSLEYDEELPSLKTYILSPFKAAKKLFAAKTDEKSTSSKSEKKLSFAKTDEKVISFKAEKKLPFAKTDEKITSFKAEKKLPFAKTDEKITSFKAEKKLPFAKTDEKITSFKAEKKLPFAKTDEKITSFKTEKKLPFAKTDEKITSFKAEKKLPFAKTDEKITYFKTVQKLPFAKTDDKITSFKAEKKLPFAKTDEKITSFKTAKKLPFAKTDDKITSFKAEKKLPFAKTDKKITFLKAEKKLPFAKTDEKITYFKAEKKLPFAKTDEKITSFKAEKKLPFAKTDEKITSFKAEKKLPFAKTDEKITSFKAEKKLPFAKTDEKITFFKAEKKLLFEAEKKLPFAKTDEKITSFKAEKKLPFAKIDEKVISFKAEKKLPFAKTDEMITSFKAEKKLPLLKLMRR